MGSSERELKGTLLNRLRPPVSRSKVPDEPPGTRTHAKHRPSWSSAFGAGLETRLGVRRTNLPHDLMSPALGDFLPLARIGRVITTTTTTAEIGHGRVYGPN